MTVKFERNTDSYTGGYVVKSKGQAIGWIDRWDGGQWAMNCKEDGCWCCGYVATREAAAEAFLRRAAVQEGQE